MRLRLAATAAILAIFFVATIGAFLLPNTPLVGSAATLLAPLRIANGYGLFAVMTTARYEVEFQGTLDGRTWVSYPFRYKPQDVRRAPPIFAPYQPRFDWNLWFASLAPWQQNEWVVATEVRLLDGSRDVLRLFAGDPFHGRKPVAVRTVLWQYWFTTSAERARSGAWWKRELRGPFAPPVSRDAQGRVVVAE